jgi:type 1 glutamine amidotransferase
VKRALLLSGGWPGHEPLKFAELFASTLRAEGFEARISESLDALLDLAGVDLIVPIWTMGTIAEPQEKALLDAVAAGAGLAGWHGGMGDAFRSATGYQFMVGGQFVSHPDGIVEYEVRIARPEDPIVRGLSDFKVRSEQYYMHVDPAVEVLATTTFRTMSAPWVNGVVMPAVWKKRWGEGRVFYSSIGHHLADFDVPQVRELTRRGALWASR